MRRMREEALPESIKRFPVWAHPHRAVVRFTYRTEAFVTATTLLGVLHRYRGSAFGLRVNTHLSLSVDHYSAPHRHQPA